jgi:hypothetical protein
MFDLIIVYRVYPGIAKNPLMYNQDKRSLAELCFASMVQALSGVKAKLFVILDNCPEYSEFFLKHWPDQNIEFIFNIPSAGNAGTFRQQAEILMGYTIEQPVYFAEDDYLYRPGAFRAMLDMLQSSKADFITPYDHPDYYSMPLHSLFEKKAILQDGIRAWHKRYSTCLTFMTRAGILANTWAVFSTYCTKKNFDSSIWFVLTGIRLLNPYFLLLQPSWYMLTVYTKAILFTPLQLFIGKRYLLIAPSPAVATHFETGYTSPGFDWQSYAISLAKSIHLTEQNL